MDDSEMDGPDYDTSKACHKADAHNEPEEKQEPYCFSNGRRGVAVVIIFSKGYKGETRPGWEIDKKHLKKTFEYLGFETHIYKNLGKTELLDNLTGVSKKDHSDCDCFVLAVSSHGQEDFPEGIREDQIETTDSTVKTREIVDMFTDKACPSLAGKPRLFFIQACRGKSLDDGHEVFLDKTSSNDDMTDATPVHNDLTDVVPMGARDRPKIKHQHTQQHQQDIDITNLSYRLRSAHITKEGRQVLQEGELPAAFTTPVNTNRDRRQVLPVGALLKPVVTKEPTVSPKLVVSPAPCHKDFLVMYATPPGYMAFRRPNEGSWFVKTLAEVLCKSDGKRNLTKELTRVIRLVAENYSSSSKDEKKHRKKQTPVIYSMLCKDIFMVPKKSVQEK